MNERDGKKVLRYARERDREEGLERGICVFAAKLRRCISPLSKCVFVGRHASISSRTPGIGVLTNLVTRYDHCGFRILSA